MSAENYHREYRIYGVIAIIIVFVIILAIFFSSNRLTAAYIDDDILVANGWFEDINDRYYDERSFGLEKQASFTYRTNLSLPSFITVTSIKTLFMMSEEELLKKTTETINFEAGNLDLVLDNSSKITGERLLDNSHKTMYVIYNGTDESEFPYEEIKIIGETWNCANSGTSIICIGLSQITGNNSEESLMNWATILKDNKGTFNEIYNSSLFLGSDGLISNVECH